MPQTMPRSLKNRLRKFRLEKGLTQQELAQAIGVSRQTIIALERGDSTPSVKVALKLADLFGLKLERIFWLEMETGEH